MGIVLPVAGFGRHYALKDIIACLEIGVPEGIPRIGEGFCEGFHWGIQTLLVEDLDKGKVHVDIVIKTRRMIVPPFYQMLVPVDRIIVRNEIGVLELGGPAIGAAYDLTCPGAPDLVLKDLFGEFDFCG